MEFKVPQFIDVESKIIGPISGRQFVVVMVTLGLMFLWYQLTSWILFIPLAIVTATLGGMLAFGKINGQPMHYFILNLFQTLRRPPMRVWRRPLFHPDQKKESGEIAPVAIKLKEPLATSTLAKVSLVVDTGGAYRPEEENKSALEKNTYVKKESTH